MGEAVKTTLRNSPNQTVQSAWQVQAWCWQHGSDSVLAAPHLTCSCCLWVALLLGLLLSSIASRAGGGRALQCSSSRGEVREMHSVRVVGMHFEHSSHQASHYTRYTGGVRQP